MKKFLISYATPDYFENQERLNKSALNFNIHEVRAYTVEDIQRTSFYEENKSILDQRRGAGYWLWKPYIILDFMEKINYGDLLIYLDVGIEIVKDLSPLIDICIQQDGILLFGTHGHLNRTLTKRDCFIAMNCDSEEYHNSEMVKASIQIYIKNEKSIAFLKEYLSFCQNPNVITDAPNILGSSNFPDFVDHRHDESVLSLLAVKHQIELFRDPSQWGNYLKMEEFREKDEFIKMPYSAQPYTNSPYHTLLNQHRQRPEANRLFKFYKVVERLVPPQTPFILVDEQRLPHDHDSFSESDFFPGRVFYRFLGKGEEFWGLPTDDRTAIEELEKLRKTGVGFIVFYWQCFWWFDYYREFYQYLNSQYSCVLNTEHCVIFDLQKLSV